MSLQTSFHCDKTKLIFQDPLRELRRVIVAVNPPYVNGICRPNARVMGGGGDGQLVTFCAYDTSLRAST